jgi:hypothetical protein
MVSKTIQIRCDERLGRTMTIAMLKRLTKAQSAAHEGGATL